MSREEERLRENNAAKTWKKWGPYLTDRQWGTVREDYSENGEAWYYTTHDMARSKAYRWGEEGIGGISDSRQWMCFAPAFWNKKDPIIKERYFGLTNSETNHGEDVKELYYYIDATPTHSYLKMLYKYPQAAYPYQQLIDESKSRNRFETEYELMDTGIFNEDKYFDIFIEYAKAAEEDILIKITVCNRGHEDAPINILPQLWFRNVWSWGYDMHEPQLNADDNGNIMLQHEMLGKLILYAEEKAPLLFCNNETNNQKLYNSNNIAQYVKDGVNEYLVHGNNNAVGANGPSTKVALNYDVIIKAGEQKQIKLRLNAGNKNAFADFDEIFNKRINEADEFYNDLQREMKSDDAKLVQRQAFAGMIWNKQYYYYNLHKWINGDPGQLPPPESRKYQRNKDWKHIHNRDIISMPDKWEYPWYAVWDSAFHCVTFSLIDAQFAKSQLLLFTSQWYLHPNGQLPAYEWSFDSANPPVQAWAAWRIYKIDEKRNGKKDNAFLEEVFQKLLLNFTWWVNRKDVEGNNVFQGGFLGLDNIGVFDRNVQLPGDMHVHQSDGTSWMAMYALNMMRIALELAQTDKVYESMATKFFEHFLYIAEAISGFENKENGLWDDEDEFYYDMVKEHNGESTRLKLRSLVGLIPLFAVEIIDEELLRGAPEFAQVLEWFLEERPHLAKLVSRWGDSNGEKRLLSLLRGHRMKKLLERMLDEKEFLSDYGVRSLSKIYDVNPFYINLKGHEFNVKYAPGEDTTGMFGGNSNWRGPIWFPINFLLIESLQRFYHYYGDDFKIECPKGSGNYCTLLDVADILTDRLCKIFLKDENNRRVYLGDNEKMQTDTNFNSYILFNEYFHGDSGKGLGASHQTGWTGLIAKLMMNK